MQPEPTLWTQPSRRKAGGAGLSLVAAVQSCADLSWLQALVGKSWGTRSSVCMFIHTHTHYLRLPGPGRKSAGENGRRQEAPLELLGLMS